MEIIKHKLLGHSAGKVLDVGTGPGKFIFTLIKVFDNYEEIIGIDVNQNILEQAKVNFRNNSKVSFKLINSDKLDFPDNYFDTVSISNTLHHLPNCSEMLSEMLRVLKPGGLIIINEMFNDNQNERQMSHVLYHHLKSDIETALGYYHRNTYKKQEIIDIVANSQIMIKEALEYIEEKEDYKIKEELDILAHTCDADVAKAVIHPRYEEFKARGNEVKRRMYEQGYQRATQLVILGTK